MGDQKIEKQATIFTQAQAGYLTLSPKDNQACANCVFFRDTGYDGIDWQHCHLVEAYPQPILPTGYCNEWRAVPAPPPELTEAVAEAVSEAVEEVVETLVDAMPTTITVSAEHPKRRGVVERVKELFVRPSSANDAFQVHKGSDGNWYWIASYTNAYEDKEGEIFTEKSHEEYIQRVDMGLVDKPELWLWHTKGTKHGQADQVFGVGRMVVAVGHFDDTPLAKAALKYYQKNAGKIKLSHGALAPKWAIQKGIIASYNTFEISTLPDGAESNPYTSYEVVKAMNPEPKKIAWMEQLVGKELTAQVVQGQEEKSKALEEMQVRYKDFGAVSDTPVESDTETQKSMGEVFVEMVKEQGSIVTLLQAMEKRQEASDKLLKEYKEEIVELRKLVNAGPRRPAEDESTALSDDASVKLKEKLFDGISKDDSAFWGAPVKGTN